MKTKKIPRTLVAFLHKHIAGLKQVMNLNDYKTQVNFGFSKEFTMKTEVDHRYLVQYLTINRKQVLEFWYDGDKAIIIECLAHELAHVISWEMSSPFHHLNSKRENQDPVKTHFEERVTQRIARLALRVYELEMK